MMLNTDDTPQEQISNSVAHRIGKEVMVNCEQCSRLFYVMPERGRELLKNHKLFCPRCSKIEFSKSKEGCV